MREVVDEVGRDAVRFMMLYRKNDAVLDFDLAKVMEQSRDNPVFYVQYGHARGHSIFRNARTEVFPELPEDAGERIARSLTRRWNGSPTPSSSTCSSGSQYFRACWKPPQAPTSRTELPFISMI